MDYRAIVEIIGALPPYYEISSALWGAKADVDSDGDSDTPESTKWRELTLIKRPEYEQRLDIDPMEGNSQRLLVRASSAKLLCSVIQFLEGTGSVQQLDA